MTLSVCLVADPPLGKGIFRSTTYATTKTPISLQWNPDITKYFSFWIRQNYSNIVNGLNPGVSVVRVV